MPIPPQRILFFTPVFPKLNKGAAEQDQIYGALRLQEMGHAVRMAAFLPDYQSPADVFEYGHTIGLDVVSIPYPATFRSFASSVKRLVAALQQPALLDGAAYQHAHPAILQFAEEQIGSHRPDLVWLDNNFLWPVALLAKAHGIPVIFRSQNFEPAHVLDEGGRSLPNYIRYAGKYLGELTALRLSTLLVAITPVEQARYRRLSRQDKVELMPLRGLPVHLRPPRPPNNRRPLNVFYWGSTYNVSHNRAALSFVTRDLTSHLRSTAPGEFSLHIFGGKVPADIQALAADDLIIHGFIPDLEPELANMNIALVPSLYGCGMQQKIFEPLCRGFPTVTSERGLAGYSFLPGRDVLTAQTAEQFVTHLLELRKPERRAELSENASRRAAELFSAERQAETLDRILQRALE